MGGIAAGIVAGFLLIGALAFFFVLRPKNHEGDMVHHEEGQAQIGEQDQIGEQETKGFSSINASGGRLSRGY